MLVAALWPSVVSRPLLGKNPLGFPQRRSLVSVQRGGRLWEAVGVWEAVPQVVRQVAVQLRADALRGARRLWAVLLFWARGRIEI